MDHAVSNQKRGSKTRVGVCRLHHSAIRPQERLGVNLYLAFRKAALPSSSTNKRCSAGRNGDDGLFSVGGDHAPGHEGQSEEGGLEWKPISDVGLCSVSIGAEPIVRGHFVGAAEATHRELEATEWQRDAPLGDRRGARRGARQSGAGGKRRV